MRSSFARVRRGGEPSCGLFQISSDEAGALLDELAVVFFEGGWEMTVDIEFSDYLTVHKNRGDDLRLGFERTGEIAGIAVHVVDDHSLSGGNGGPTDPLMQRDASVGSCGSYIRAENEHGLGTVCAVLEHVEADPVVVRQHVLQSLNDNGHEMFGAVGGIRQMGEFIRQSLIVRGHEPH